MQSIQGLINFSWDYPGNRKLLLAAISLILLEWIIFKTFYPYPNLTFDSYHYVKAAVLNSKVNIWPIGYSQYLRFLRFFSPSINLPLMVQYLLLEFSFLAYYFSWLYFFQPGKGIKIAVFFFLFVNPLYHYCSNYLLSDSLFIALSTLWISQFFWIVYRPRPWMIVSNAILIVLAFTIRYNAMYYPLIGLLAFLFSRQVLWRKLIGIGLPVLLMVGFIRYTSQETARLTGKRQFSAFGAWKLANDALYAYNQVYRTGTGKMPMRFQGVDSAVRNYFQRQKDPFDVLKADSSAGSDFMFQPSSPLVLYMNRRFDDKPLYLNSDKWLAIGPLYQDYALHLIKKYPVAYARYFVLPNFYRYAVPPADMLGSGDPFYLYERFGAGWVRAMYGVNSITIDEKYIRLSRSILFPYPIIFAVLHLGFLLGFAGFIYCGGLKKISRPYTYIILLAGTLWLIDLGFSVLSAGIVLRYQVFLSILEFSFGFYFLQYVYQNLDADQPSKPALNDISA